jgi:hypothetical protein
MSQELLTNAIKALRILAKRSGANLERVQLIVSTKDDAKRLFDIARADDDAPAESPPMSDIVTSQQDIMQWADGPDVTALPDAYGGQVDGLPWEIEWRGKAGPLD